MTPSDIQLLPTLLNELSEELALSEPLKSCELLLRLDAEISFSSVRLKEFTSERVEKIISAFGSAIEDFRVSYQGDPYWRKDQHGSNVNSLQSFLSGQTQEMVLRIDINKTKLLQECGLAESSNQQSHFIYLFGERVPFLFSDNLQQCERGLWGREGTEQAILFVCDTKLLLVGDYLMICGGDYLLNWKNHVRMESAADVNSPALPCDKIRLISQDKLNWQTEWVQHLTPLHFDVKNKGEQDSTPISRVLSLRCATFFLLYTAEQTKNEDGQFVSIYQRGQTPVPVIWKDALLGIKQNASDLEIGAIQLAALIRWLYEPSWTTDRLLTAQLYFATELRHIKKEICFDWMIQNAARFKTDLEARWVSFIEKKLDAYSEQERKFEDDVIKVSQGFDEQIGGMIQTLVTNGLATVAAFVTAFIVALYKDPFNAQMFIWGLTLYALYIVIFPVLFGLSLQRGRFLAAEKEFNSRCTRIKIRLGEEKTTEIMTASQFYGNKRRFHIWFGWASSLYILLIVAILVSAFLMPGFIERSKATQKSGATFDAHNLLPVKSRITSR